MYPECIWTMSSDERPRLHCSWFCPFAQRVWMSLLYKNIDFEYIEQNPYDKTAEWLAVSPRGLIPCLVDNGRSVYESGVCIEYIDENWPKNPRLMPEDSYSRAVVRMWSDHISKKIVPYFYSLLLKRSDQEREAAKEGLLRGIRLFQDAIHGGGPFFTGQEAGLADMMLAPFAQRMCKNNVLHHFRDFYVPETADFAQYQRWWDAVQAMPAFQETAQTEERLFQNYQKYADDYATTEMAVAIRAGKALP